MFIHVRVAPTRVGFKLLMVFRRYPKIKRIRPKKYKKKRWSFSNNKGLEEILLPPSVFIVTKAILSSIHPVRKKVFFSISQEPKRSRGILKEKHSHELFFGKFVQSCGLIFVSEALIKSRRA